MKKNELNGWVKDFKRLWSSLYTIYQRTVCKMQTKWYRTFGG